MTGELRKRRRMRLSAEQRYLAVFIIPSKVKTLMEELIRTLSCWTFREKIHYIRTEGTQGVEKLSCDADLVILLR